MTWQTGLYFGIVLAAVVVSGFLAWQAWLQREVPGGRYYFWLAAVMCLVSIEEVFSMVSGTSDLALFWFKMRFLPFAVIPPLWLLFTLDYSGRRRILSKGLIAGLFIIPLATQIILWINPGGIWLKHEVGFRLEGPFWLADLGQRLPGVWYLVNAFYSYFLLLVGSLLLLQAAWKQARLYRQQTFLLIASVFVMAVVTFIASFNLLPPGSFNPTIPGFALSAALAAAAIFRFEFLQRPLTRKARAFDEQESRTMLLFLLVFGLLMAGIIAAAYLYYERYQAQYRAQVDAQLSAVAELKANELVTWRNERMADAETIRANPAFAALVQRFQENPGDQPAREQLQAWLGLLCNYYGYDQAFLVDTRFVIQLSSPIGLDSMDAHLLKDLPSTLESGQVTFLDFHRHSDDNSIYLGLLVPIYAGLEENRPLGVLVLRINPDDYLYPFIQHWPLPGTSGETLLIRREGEDVLYLDSLRFRQDVALNLRFSLQETELPATKAVLGETSIVEGVDDRGAPVVADIRPVPNSPWFLVSKMDSAEIYSPLQAHLWQTITFFSLLILTTGAGMLSTWNQQRVRFYRGQTEAAEALRKSNEKYQELVEHAPDGIFIADSNGKYIEVNPGGCAMLGYTRAEILSLRISDLVAAEDQAATPLRLDELRQGKTVLSERRLVCKDGSLLPVEISGRMLPDGRFQSITRNITARKRAEDALRESEEKYRLLFENVMDGFALHEIVLNDKGQPINYVFLEANHAFEQLTGLKREDIIGRKVTEVLPGIENDPADWIGKYGQVTLTGKEIRFEQYAQSLGKWYSVLAFRVREGQFAAIFEDITERKRVEEAEREQRSLAEALRDTAAALASTLSFDEVLDRILVEVSRVVPHDAARILLVEEGVARTVLSRGYAEQEPEALSQMLHAPVDTLVNLRAMAATCRPLAIPDTRSYPGWLDWPQTRWVRSNASAPIKIKEQVIGFLGLDSAQPGFFSQAHAERLQAFADQAGIALENARLLTETRQRARELAALYDTALATSSVLDRDALLAGLHERVHQLIAADGFLIALYDAGAAEFEIALALEESRSVPELAGLRAALTDGGLTGWVLRHRQTLLIGDLERESAPAQPIVSGRPARAWLGVPLVAHNRLIGAVSVQAFRPHAFDEDDRRLLESLAAPVAIALENARLYEEVRRYAAGLEQKVAERTAELTQREAALRAANEQLEQLSRIKSEFVSNVSHELRTPLTNIKSYLWLLEKGKPEKHAKYMETLHR